MTSQTGPRPGSGARMIAAGLHSVRGTHRLVILRRADFNSPWSVAESRSLTDAQLPGVAEVCAHHKLFSVVRIAPAPDCICRTIDVPVGDPAQMASAASLLAEAELPVAIPPHRRAGSLIPEAQRHGVRTALLTGWLDRAKPGPAIEGIEEYWTTPVACLAVLRGEGRLAMYADPAEGAMIVLATGHERSAARVIIESGEDQETWANAKRDAVAETAQRVNLESTEPVSPGRLTLDRTSRAQLSQIAGVRDDANWMDEFGMALGAALLANDPVARPLAGLRSLPPKEERSPAIRLALWISTPRHAAWTAVAACAVLLLAPWGLAWARSEVLSRRTQVLEKMRGTKAEIEKKAALYNQLEISRWPMTKLLSDLSGATPVGIIATDVRLSPEQGLVLQGTADKSELVNTLQANLSKTKLFRNVKVNRVESNAAGGVEFNLTADVPSGLGHTPVTPVDDFAAKSLSMRLHGVEAGPRSEGGEGGQPASARATRRPPRNAEAAADEKEESTDRKPSSSETIPPVVTDAEIEKMDLATATKGWIARKVYVQKNPTVDGATKQRLQDEEMKIRAHADKLKSSGGAPK